MSTKNTQYALFNELTILHQPNLNCPWGGFASSKKKILSLLHS